MIKFCITFPTDNTASHVGDYIGDDWAGFKAQLESTHAGSVVVDITGSSFPLGHSWNLNTDDSYDAITDTEKETLPTFAASKARAISYVKRRADSQRDASKITYKGKVFTHKESIIGGLTKVLTLQSCLDFTGSVLPVKLLDDNLESLTLTTVAEVDEMLTSVVGKDVTWNNGTVDEIVKIQAMSTIAELVVYTDNRIY